MTATHFHSSARCNTISNIQGRFISECYSELLGITWFPFAELNVIVNEIWFICIKHSKFGDIIAIAEALWVLFLEDPYKIMWFIFSS